jgi:hypothetical protein
VTLLLGVALFASLAEQSAAAFTEYFMPSEKPNSQAITPGLWKQIGEISQGRGRGTDEATNNAMMLREGKPTAETVLLAWDGTKGTLDFWYYLTDACDSGSLKVTMSCNTLDWFSVWGKKLGDMQVDAYNIARVQLPLNTTCPNFAVRWDYSVNLGICYLDPWIYLDEITIPARGPADAAEGTLPAGKATQTASSAGQSGPVTQGTTTDGAESATASTQSSDGSSGSTATATNNAGDTNVIVKNSLPSSKGSSMRMVTGWLLLPALCMFLL